MRRRPAVLALPLLLTALLAVAACSDGQDAGERIRAYDVDLVVTDDGSVRVTETIVYAFGDEDRHGIERVVPQRLPWAQTQDRVTEVTDVEVSSPSGAPADLETSQDDGDLVLRVGDEDVEVTGEQTYVVAFTADAVATRGPRGPVVAWTAVGPDWQVPVDAASVTVQGPGVTALTCAVGDRDGDGCTVEGTTVTAVDLGEDPLTVRFAVAGEVATEPVLRETFSPAQAFGLGPVPVGLSVAVLLAVLVPVSVRRRRSVVPDDAAAAGRLRRVTGPPEGLAPARLGTVHDGVAGLHEITATVIDLARRGVVRLEEAWPDGRDGDAPSDWRLHRTGSPGETALLPSEDAVVRALFGADDGRGDLTDDPVLMSTVHGRTPALGRVRAAMHRDAVEQGWFTDDPARVRSRWYVLSAVLVVGGAALLVPAVALTTLALVPAAVVLSGLVVLLLAGGMPVRTPDGVRLLRATRAYRAWLAAADPDDDVLDRHLPEAVALQVVDAWRPALERGSAAGTAPAVPTWYGGDGVSTPSWPVLLVLTSTGGAPGSPTSTSTTTTAGGGGGGSW